MNRPFYPFTTLDEATRFDFVSVGKEIVPKTIVFYQTDDPLFFTLTLANLLPDGRLYISTKSNNGDLEMILATVFQSITIFLTHRPGVIVGFKGSSDSRTRLYQIAIAKELEQAAKRFNIWGLTDTGLEPFRVQKMYDGFFISFKNVNIE
jgi:hypothetical protein